MTNIYQGDPKLILTENGSSLVFKSGQPVMDQGLENLVLISLFTRRGWCGNILSPVEIGSDFEAIANQPITRTMLIDLEQEARNALKNEAFGNVLVIVNNPASQRLVVIITIQPPGQDIKTLTLTKYGSNWLYQGSDPAYKRV